MIEHFYYNKFMWHMILCKLARVQWNEVIVFSRSWEDMQLRVSRKTLYSTKR